MYQYLDRPVADLSVADRCLLDGVRSWALARALGRDTLGAMTARPTPLAGSGAAETLDDAMLLLDEAGTTPLMLQRPCHDTVEEDEAVLLAIAERARTEALEDAVASLRHLVRDEAAKPVALLLGDAARRLGEATLIRR